MKRATGTSNNANSKSVRDVNCMIHGTVSLSYPLNLIVDTPEFQRLRRLRQCGAVNFVYPNADHCRFAHSLGTMSLAADFVHTLRVQQPELDIDDCDELCISIAGLCHDLGHGPFSHIYDGPFLAEADPDCKWTHEKGSIDMMRRIFAYPWIRSAMDEFLAESDYTFIEECIDPLKPKLDKHGNWLCTGRSKAKSFLFDIVSNSNDSFDVDKFDYLLRDSHHASIGIAFNLNSVARLRKNMLVLFDPALQLHRICYAHKVKDELLNVGQSRQSLHENLYRHQTVEACEHLMVKAMSLASSHLKFLGDNGKVYSLANVHQNVAAFVNADDGIFSIIQNSTSENLLPAKKVLEDLRFRRLPRLVGATNVPAGFPKQSTSPESLNNEIRKFGKNLQSTDFFIMITHLHRGLGTDMHPLKAVAVFNNKLPPEQMVPEAVDQNWFAGKSVDSGGFVKFSVYVQHNATTEIFDSVFAALKAFAKRNNVRMPLKRWTAASPVQDAQSKNRRREDDFTTISQ